MYSQRCTQASRAVDSRPSLLFFGSLLLEDGDKFPRHASYLSDNEYGTGLDSLAFYRGFSFGLSKEPLKSHVQDCCWNAFGDHASSRVVTAHTILFRLVEGRHKERYAHPSTRGDGSSISRTDIWREAGVTLGELEYTMRWEGGENGQTSARRVASPCQSDNVCAVNALTTFSFCLAR